MQLGMHRHRFGGGLQRQGPPAGTRLAAHTPAAAAVTHSRPRRRAAVVRAAAGGPSGAGPQPLADVALGGGRLASGLANFISNPKEDKALAKKKREWQAQQDAEAAARARQEAAAAEDAAAEAGAAAAAAAAAEATAGEAGAVLVDPLGLLPAGAEGQQQQQQQHAGGAPEALATAVTAQQAHLQQQAQQAQHSIVSEYTDELVEEVVEVPVRTLAQRLQDTRTFLTSSTAGRGISAAAGLLLGATLALALHRTWQKYSSPRAQRMRVIDKNKLLVEELSKLLPEKRGELTPGMLRKLRAATGFSPVEVFRKYLWFALRERQFDAGAVADMVLLKQGLGLSDAEVAEALRERAQRIYDKYGTLMLNTEGMTAEGVERKATCRALFSKLLYLTEHEPLLAQGGDALREADLRTIFGATEEDVEGLRIVSLYAFDVDKMESLVAAADADEAPAGGSSGSSSGAQTDTGSGAQPGGGGSSSSGQTGADSKA